MLPKPVGLLQNYALVLYTWCCTVWELVQLNQNKSAEYVDVYYSKNSKLSNVCLWSVRDCCSTSRNVCAVKPHWEPPPSNNNNKWLVIVPAHCCECCLEQIPVTMLRPVFSCQNSCLDIMTVLVSALSLMFSVYRLSASTQWSLNMCCECGYYNFVSACSACPVDWCCVISWCILMHNNIAPLMLVCVQLSPNSTMPTFPWRPRQVCDKPVTSHSAPISVWGSFGEVDIMEFGLNGTSRVCPRCHR